VALISIPAFSTAANAADPKAKSKSKALKPLPPGPAWADTNHDGQLSDAELRRAIQILKEKIKQAESKSQKSAQSTTAKSTKK
jgi:hypothetical protein